MNIQRIILTIIIFGYMMTTVSAETYITYVDDGLGFYKVRDVTASTNKFTYEKHTLEINQGDSIVWENDAEKTTFTIVSEQNLWDDKIGYLRVGSKLNYKFDKPGEYTLYIKEYTSKRQTVIVNAKDGASVQTVVPTPISTPIPTSTIFPGNTTAVPVHTVIQASNNITKNPVQFPDIKIPVKIPVKISPTMIASVVVALLSIFITYKAGRNKR